MSNLAPKRASISSVLIGAVIVSLLVGAAAGYVVNMATAAPATTRTVTSTQTVGTATITQTITQTGGTATQTITQTATQTGGTSAFPNGQVSIGVIGPLTGANSGDGQDFVNGATMAVNQLNAQGGVDGYKVNLVTGDVGSSFAADQVTSVITQMITSTKVDAIFTGYSGETQFEDNIMQQYNMPYVISADSQSTEAIMGSNASKYPTVWNTVPSYVVYQTELPKRMAMWESEGLITLHSHTVAFITSDNAYSTYISNGMAANFKAMGWTITMNQTVAFGTITDWTPILTQIRSNPPELIVDTDYIPSNEAALITQFLQNPTNSYIFMQYGPSTAEFLTDLGSKANGILYNLPYLSPYVAKYTQGADLLKNFVAQYHYQPGLYALQLYVQIMIWADAARLAGTPKNHLAVGNFIGNSTAYWGPGGLIVFDPSTHLASSSFMPMTFYQIWNSTRYVIDPAQYEDIPIKAPPWFSS